MSVDREALADALADADPEDPAARDACATLLAWARGEDPDDVDPEIREAARRVLDRCYGTGK